jgi:NHL repeat
MVAVGEPRGALSIRRRTLVVAVALVSVLVGAVLLLSVAGSPPASGAGGSKTPTTANLAGTGVPGAGGDGGAATHAQLDAPSAVAVDRAGDLFVADTANCRVRAVPARTGLLFGRRVHVGEIVTVAGGSCGAAHPEPTALAVDASGDLFVDYATAARIDELTTGRVALGGAPVRTGSPVTVAGTGSPGASGDGGPATKADFELPSGVATDPSGDLLVADTGNCRLRLVAATDGVHDGVSMVRGEVATVAGTGVCGSAGDGGPALAAQLWDPGALAVDPAGDVVLADQGNRTVRLLAASSGTYFGVPLSAGDLGTVAGEGSYGPYLLDGLPALGQTGELNDPSGLALGPGGGFYVSDGAMHAVRFVADASTTLFGSSVPSGAMVTVAGARPSGTLDNRVTWVRTHLSQPLGLAVASSGALVYADAGTHTVGVIRGATG